MPSIEDQLRDDAARWRDSASQPPALSNAVDTTLARSTGSKRRRYGLMLAAVASVAAVVGLVVVVAHQSAPPSPAERPPAAPPFITVHGDRLDYAGDVPWADSVSDPADPRVVYVFADNNRTQLTINACAVENDRPVVRETAHSVTISVAGYAHTLPEGGRCLTPGPRPVPVAVHLGAPLGDRALIDGQGNRHRVLDAATVPMPTEVDRSCTPGVLAWSERTGIVQRFWFGPPHTCSMQLTYGPTDAMDRLRPPSGHRSSSIAISRHATAQVWIYRTKSPPRYELTIRWFETAGFEIQLTSGGPSALSSRRLISVARSVR
jgi:hypothetical protein